MRVAARREMHADASGTPNANGGVSDLDQQSRAIFDSAAVPIRALVRGVLQELIEQVTVGPVNLHAVEAGDRAFSAPWRKASPTPAISSSERACGTGRSSFGRSRLT
jgi:hypothetical protein